MNFVRFGNVVINLDRITYVSPEIAPVHVNTVFGEKSGIYYCPAISFESTKSVSIYYKNEDGENPYITPEKARERAEEIVRFITDNILFEYNNSNKDDVIHPSAKAFKASEWLENVLESRYEKIIELYTILACEMEYPRKKKNGKNR